MAEGSKCLEKGGGGPCAHRSSWVIRRIKDLSVMATKGLLCIHSRGLQGWWATLAPRPGWGGSGFRLLPLPRRVEGPVCQLSEWGQVLRAPYIWERPRDHSFRRLRAAKGSSLCFSSPSFHLSSIPTPPSSLDTLNNYGLSFSFLWLLWLFLFQRFSLTNRTWPNNSK